LSKDEALAVKVSDGRLGRGVMKPTVARYYNKTQHTNNKTLKKKEESVA
jgi:hypothetical protein